MLANVIVGLSIVVEQADSVSFTLPQGFSDRPVPQNRIGVEIATHVTGRVPVA